MLARYSGEFTGKSFPLRLVVTIPNFKLASVTVFRELLQNSDDARSSAVEIRFETAAYLRRKDPDGGQGNTDIPTLPNLKTTHVRISSAVMLLLMTSVLSRLPNGRLETMESPLETRTGHDYAR